MFLGTLVQYGANLSKIPHQTDARKMSNRASNNLTCILVVLYPTPESRGEVVKTHPSRGSEATLLHSHGGMSQQRRSSTDLPLLTTERRLLDPDGHCEGICKLRHIFNPHFLACSSPRLMVNVALDRHRAGAGAIYVTFNTPQLSLYATPSYNCFCGLLPKCRFQRH